MPAGETTRRAALGACVAAPLLGAAMLAGRARAALVGARDFGDSRVEGAGYPKVLVDAAGVPRRIAQPPRRIVSTYLGCDEVLAAVVSVERVAAVSVYADDRGNSNCAGFFPPRVGRLRTEPESVLAVEPDLICVAGFADVDSLRMLTATDVPVLRWSHFDSFAQVVQSVRLLGAATGDEARAAAVAMEVERTLADLARRLAAVRPLRVLFYDTPGFTMGSGTLIDEMIVRAGGRNAAAEIGIRGTGTISMEAVLAAEPDAIVVPRYGQASAARTAITAQPLWRRLPAVVDDRVYEVPAPWLTSVSHHAARAVVAMARLLHPAAFAGRP